MFQVVKRDGELDGFKMGKITAAIDKAFDAKGKNYSPDMIDLLGLRVTADFQNKIENNRISVEDIQDSVENVLIQAGYSDVANADLTWGLNNIFKNDFHTITFAMYPIYLNIGFGYAF